VPTVILDVAGLDRWLTEQLRSANAPGLAVAALRDRELCYARGFGLTRADGPGTAVTPDTLFHIASTTKPLTGTAIMRLVERGTLELDRPVREYVPGLRLGRDDAGADITLRMLLSHTSGLPGGRYDPVGPGDAGALGRWARRSLPRYRLLARPGARYAYGNAAINFAGYVAEVSAEKPFAELLQQLLFDPLGMRRTTFDPAAALAHPLARGHYDDDTGAPAVAPDLPVNAARAPAAFAFSTALDLAAFATVHLSEGRLQGRPFLRPDSVREMHAPHVATGQDGTDGYGLTFGTDTYKGVRVVEHDGEGGWSTSQLLLAPDHGAAAIVLCHAHRPELTAAVANHLLDVLLDLP
jgi:CubicO group peptidase (beta-lactamase class C family)